VVSVSDIKADLPNFPDEVIEDWLLYFANEPNVGWPPPVPLGDHRWAGILGDRPLSWWRRLTWNKEWVNCGYYSLARKTCGVVKKMMKDITSGAVSADEKRRYTQAFQHILENGTFYRPLVAMKLSGTLLVLDGNHRIGAFYGLQIGPDEFFAKGDRRRPQLGQEAWVGKHPDGEVPLS
jgi:hypothetical protein